MMHRTWWAIGLRLGAVMNGLSVAVGKLVARIARGELLDDNVRATARLW